MSTLESRMSARRIADERVTIVGAGPAGLACAIALARGGRAVVVREWHRQVGTRFHGDFQGLENWSDERDVHDELRAEGIEITFEHHAVSEGIGFDAHHNRYKVRSDRPLYYLVRRGRGALDTALLDQALAAGVVVRRVDRVETVSGRAVLAAGPRRADAIAAGYLFDTEMADGGWVPFDDHLAPLGYTYLLVCRGRGTVASCMFTGFKRQAEHVERTVAFFREHAGPRHAETAALRRLCQLSAATHGNAGWPSSHWRAGGLPGCVGRFWHAVRLSIRATRARSILDGTDYITLWRRELLPLLRAGIEFIFNSVGVGARGEKSS